MANVEDACKIAEVHVKSWQNTYKGLISQEYLDNLKIKDRYLMWKKVLSNKNELVFVAENNDEIIGFASFGKERISRQETDGELYAIYLLKSHKRQKVGTNLLKAGIQELIKRKFKTLLVWVLADNPSKKFYEHSDPASVATEKDQMGDLLYEEIAYKWDNLYLLEKLLS
jgi:ribosomal protein S18 acetylase RimI-like enzyme